MVLPSSEFQMFARKEVLLAQWWHEGYGGNYYLLDLKPSPEEGIHAWYCKPGQKPMSLDDTGKYTSVVLLNEYVDKLPSKYVQTYRSVLFSTPSQGSKNTKKTEDWEECEEVDNGENYEMVSSRRGMGI